ncbi:MAG: lipoprotein insertase outer membrane protein LolB [Gammaproteobacteria bacterium]|nr:lipoprotein insertase outer membrane protein LolB [Gammaproteobacteria bacterium]
MRLTCRHFSIAFRSVIFALLLATQFSCNYLPKATAKSPDNWSQTVAQRQQLSSWKLTGRLGMQTEDNGGSLDLFWNQQDDAYNIRLIAAMGQGTILIKGDALGVVLRTSEGETYADNADELLASSLGVSVPLSGLHDWLRGVPAANRPVQKQLWDDQGHLHKLVQDGWNIEMSGYKKVGEHILPHAFYLDRDDQPELEIRLLIRQWNLVAREVS